MIIEIIGAQINIIKVLWYKKSEFMQFIVTQPSINYEWRCWSWMVDEINQRIIHVHKGFFNKKKKKIHILWGTQYKYLSEWPIVGFFSLISYMFNHNLKLTLL